MWNSVKVALGVGLLALSAGADTYTVDPDHSEIGFSVRHMLVSNVRGNFRNAQRVVRIRPE
ncbi:MAG: YceI family protein [Kiritimatiellae bacterium]|nr:YceI family protein [Kiritimatiellia bacterium]